MHSLVYDKEKRKQKIVLTVTLIGRISLITPTFEEHNRVKQNIILGCPESSCNSYTVKPWINNCRIY